MGIVTCCMQQRPRSPVEKEKDSNKNRVWYFSNGTVVHGATSLEGCRRKMFTTTQKGNTKNYWANQISDGIYEIQFTPEVFPDITVLVSACNGNEAAKIARCSLASDYGRPSVMRVS